MTIDLHELDAFEAVARHRSFRKAAAERSVSASALSHAMRGLEERLGVRLFHRTTRSVTPTEAGYRLLARLTPALRDVADALADVTALQAVPAPERTATGSLAGTGPDIVGFCGDVSARQSRCGNRRRSGRYRG